MKDGIHPLYKDVDVRCACGSTFKTRSTKPELHLEICSACHPFFTGRQKLIDTEGRVERFNKKFGVQTVEQRKAAEKEAKATRPPVAKKVRVPTAKASQPIPPKRPEDRHDRPDRSAGKGASGGADAKAAKPAAPAS